MLAATKASWHSFPNSERGEGSQDTHTHTALTQMTADCFSYETKSQLTSRSALNICVTDARQGNVHKMSLTLTHVRLLIQTLFQVHLGPKPSSNCGLFFITQLRDNKGLRYSGGLVQLLPVLCTVHATHGKHIRMVSSLVCRATINSLSY